MRKASYPPTPPYNTTPHHCILSFFRLYAGYTPYVAHHDVQYLEQRKAPRELLNRGTDIQKEISQEEYVGYQQSDVKRTHTGELKRNEANVIQPIWICTGGRGGRWVYVCALNLLGIQDGVIMHGHTKPKRTRHTAVLSCSIPAAPQFNRLHTCNSIATLRHATNTCQKT